ncbi:MAG: AHH domain-containing protein, partial [Flavobacterium sp.]
IEKIRPDLADLIEATKSVFNKKQDLLAVISNNSELVSCEVIYPFSNAICGGGNTVDNETLLNVGKELEKCYYSEYEPKLIAGTLKEITKNSRSNQGIEFVRNEKIYALNRNGEAEEVKNPLTDDDIRNGKWTDATIDVKLRVTQNKEGIFQYQAVGIRSSLTVASGKTAILKDLAAHIESKGNAFFQQYKVIKADLTPAKAGVNLNKDDEVFADGEKIALDNNATLFKISAEGIGLLNTFLQTAEVEKPAYLTSTKNTTVIHAPGLVTGTVESGATVVTDITSLCSMVYDLSTDQKTRTEMYTGLVKLKDAVKDEPSGIIPIFVQMLSGNTNDEWAEIAKNQTDEGRKGHLYSRGVVTSVKSVLVGSALITKLPELAEDLVGKIKSVKTVINSLKHFDIAGEFAKGNNVVLNTIEWGTKNFKLKWEKVGNKITFGDRSDLAKILGTTDNIEAHHIMPWKVCEKDELVQLAALDGFHPNLVENGIGLEKYTKLVGEGIHGNHPAYDAYVSTQLDKFKKTNKNITPEQANKFLQETLIPDLKKKITEAGQTDLNLNQYFKTTINPGVVPNY